MLDTGEYMANLFKHASIHDIIDYGALMSCLRDYKAPHRKITTLLQSGKLIRIKKGLYILGDDDRDVPINRELIANLIFGPSYVSQEYALQFHGLLLERVMMVTSMSTKRNKLFRTPIGEFRYTYINTRRFTVGVNWPLISDNIHVLIASPEKALADILTANQDITTQADMTIHLLDNMRIERNDLLNVDLPRLNEIADAYRQPVITLLYETLKRGL